MSTLDAYLLDCFERFSHWWQKLTEMNCFLLAKACAFLFAFHVVFYVSVIISPVYPTNKQVVASLFLLVLILAYLGYLYAIKAETKTHSMHEKGLKNPFKLEAINFRTVVCFVDAPFASFILYSMFHATFQKTSEFTHILGSTCLLWFIPVLYFSACDPLPRGKSKVRKWIGGIIDSLRASVNPPKPAPVPSS